MDNQSQHGTKCHGSDRQTPPQKTIASAVGPTLQNYDNSPQNNTLNPTIEVKPRRGRRGPLSDEEKPKVALTRKEGACDECRRKKRKCLHARERVEQKALFENGVLTPRELAAYSPYTGSSHPLQNGGQRLNLAINSWKEQYPGPVRRYVRDDDPAPYVPRVLPESPSWRIRRRVIESGVDATLAAGNWQHCDNDSFSLGPQNAINNVRDNYSLRPKGAAAPGDSRSADYLVRPNYMLTTPPSGNRKVSMSVPGSVQRGQSARRCRQHVRFDGSNRAIYAQSHLSPFPSIRSLDTCSVTASIASQHTPYFSLANTGSERSDFDLSIRTQPSRLPLYLSEDFERANVSTQQGFATLPYDEPSRSAQQHISLPPSATYPQEIVFQVHSPEEDTSTPARPSSGSMAHTDAIPYNNSIPHNYFTPNDLTQYNANSRDTMHDISLRPLLQSQQQLQNFTLQPTNFQTSPRQQGQMHTPNNSQFCYNQPNHTNTYSSSASSVPTSYRMWSTSTNTQTNTPLSSSNIQDPEQQSGAMQSYSDNLHIEDATFSADGGLASEVQEYIGDSMYTYDNQNDSSVREGATSYGQNSLCTLCGSQAPLCGYCSR